MNYKIGDKVNISLTTPLIVTGLNDQLGDIKVSSEDGDIYFWASSKFFTPHTPPPTSPHKSLNIGDLIVTKPTAHSIYADPIGNRIGSITGSSTTKDCYVVLWIYDITTHTKFENCVNVVYIDQFAHIYAPPPRPTTSKKCVPQIGDIVVAAPGALSSGGINISNLVGRIVGKTKIALTVEWIEPLYEDWSKNIVDIKDIVVVNNL